MAATPNIAVIRKGCLEGRGFGACAYTLYEGCVPCQQSEMPCLVVWLHGGDMGDIPLKYLSTMHRRLGRHVFFLVPLSPKPSAEGLRFFWGCSYTKSQNKGGLGFIFGEMHSEFLDSMTALVRDLRAECQAEKVVVMGYSMGGFGALQFGSHAPDLYDVVVTAAGYGMGTLTRTSMYDAPQPDSSRIFTHWLEQHVCKLAHGPAVLVIHSLNDAISPFEDIKAIAETIFACGGNIKFLQIPAEVIDSDHAGSKKKSSGHHYFNYAFLDDTSDPFFFAELTAVLGPIGPQHYEASTTLHQAEAQVPVGMSNATQLLVPPAGGVSNWFSALQPSGLLGVLQRHDASRSPPPRRAVAAAVTFTGEGVGRDMPAPALVPRLPVGRSSSVLASSAASLLAAGQAMRLLGGEEDQRGKKGDQSLIV